MRFWRFATFHGLTPKMILVIFFLQKMFWRKFNKHMFWLPILSPYWSRFGAILEPILNPKINPKFVNFWVQFWISFWGFWISLGASWELSWRLSWEGLKSEKMQTVQRENHFFENVAFLVFEALDGPLGFILPPLWLIWSENGPQNGPQKWSKK